MLAASGGERSGSGACNSQLAMSTLAGSDDVVSMSLEMMIMMTQCACA